MEKHTVTKNEMKNSTGEKRYSKFFKTNWIEMYII